jgi:hypothetical protein
VTIAVSSRCASAEHSSCMKKQLSRFSMCRAVLEIVKSRREEPSSVLSGMFDQGSEMKSVAGRPKVTDCSVIDLTVMSLQAQFDIDYSTQTFASDCTENSTKNGDKNEINRIQCKDQAGG